MKSNSQLAADTLSDVFALGVKNVIICAGARNAPLVIPLLKLDGQDGIKIWHHFDERAAAFFGLGLAKRRLEPVCIVTTSGTAVAELLAAAIEAYYSGIPMILLTADRPERFRGSGAPQAIEQVGLFGSYASTEIPSWDRCSPLHLNICFEEPLLDGEPQIEIQSQEATLQFASNSLPDNPSIVLVGELLETERQAVTRFLEASQIPVWCEATSGLREAPGLNHIRGSESAISELPIDHVVRIGGVPSLRFWRDLEALENIQVTSVSRTGFSGLARKENVTTQQGIVDDSTGLSREAPTTQQGSVDDSTGLSREEQVIRDLSSRIPSEALVFLGNSLPIREWNRAATTEIPHPHVFANRGANGIDGEISTFLGLCQDFPSDECWGIFGDLTTLYDLNAPWICDQMDRGKKIRIVVINNGGGKIFSKLPDLKNLSDSEKQVTENWHGFDFVKWAELWPGIEVEVIDVKG